MDIKKIAQNALVDYSAAGVVAAYFALQSQLPSMPDLPAWAVVVLMVAALGRGAVLQFATGKVDPEVLAAALVEAAADAREAAELVEKKAVEAEAAEKGEG